MAKKRYMLRYDSIKRKYDERKKSLRWATDADEPEGWITINGAHIPVNEAGEAYGNTMDKIKEHSSESGSKGKGLTSGKNGNLTAKSPAAKAISTKDALEERDTNGELKANSLREHMDENGNLSPERQAVHEEIVRKMFADKEPFDGQATMKMSGGGPASGKSFVWDDAKGSFGESTCVKIDPDELKAMLPGYSEMAREYYNSGEKTTNAAGYYHEESSALAKMAYQYALDNNINCVYDGTGDGSVRSVASKIEAAREAGYKVEGQYVTVSLENAIERNEGRYQHGVEKYKNGESDTPPRKVPAEVVTKTHEKVTDISTQVAGLYDSFTLYDNNGARGSTPVPIAECKNGGTLTAISGQEDKLRDYLGKGKGSYDLNDKGEVVTK